MPEPEVRRDPSTGQPVLDQTTGKPLRILRNVPEFLSTQVEGWLLEVIMRPIPRLNKHVVGPVDLRWVLSSPLLESCTGASLAHVLQGSSTSK